MGNAVRSLPVSNCEIPKVLRTFYHPDALMTTGAVSHGFGRVTVYFCFPTYARSIQDMGHVSSIQITAAVIEGGYCALEDALGSNLLPAPATSEWFYDSLSKWLALRLNILFRKAQNAGEPTSLDFRVLDIGIQRLRRRQLSATIEFDGFCSGETMWVIDPPPGLVL